MEGNFGQLFDQLNRSVDLLSREFSTELVLQVTAFASSTLSKIFTWLHGSLLMRR